MALILSSQKYASANSFFKSRFLRIFPVYWTILALSISASLLIPEVERPHLKLALQFSFFNVFLIGLDFIIIIALIGGPTANSNVTLPQSWTLSLELYFYVLAPLLNKLRTWCPTTLCLTILSLTLVLYSMVGLRGSWSYRFFPLEFGFFLWGMLMYRLKRKLPKYSEVIFLFIWLFGGIYRLNPPLQANNWQSMLFPLLLGLFLNRFIVWDKYNWVKTLGKLSYPFYLVHLLITSVLVIILQKMDVSLPVIPMFLVNISLALTFSFLIVKFVENPLDRIRVRFASIL